ncbi:hypothetical protein RRG08_065314 [Elysia crispata]|uniref:C2H2-type domain-containing protein n=1 Tax=Elysia crispata TaxID=231223 RepID=A0AAE1AKU3_9GAST|nr:hypothetical protein RRG08_065314 [Elysia crispata]
MEFTLPSQKPEEDTGQIGSSWKSLNARLYSHLGRFSESAENVGKTSLLYFLGGMRSIREVLHSGPLTSENSEKSWDLLNRLSLECLPRFILLYERHKLFTSSQAEDECVCHFLMRLRHLCNICFLGEQTQSCFTSRVVEGLANSQLKQYFQRFNPSQLLLATNQYIEQHCSDCDSKLSNFHLSEKSRKEELLNKTNTCYKSKVEREKDKNAKDKEKRENPSVTATRSQTQSRRKKILIKKKSNHKKEEKEAKIEAPVQQRSCKLLQLTQGDNGAKTKLKKGQRQNPNSSSTGLNIMGRKICALNLERGMKTRSKSHVHLGTDHNRTLPLTESMCSSEDKFIHERKNYKVTAKNRLERKSVKPPRGRVANMSKGSIAGISVQITPTKILTPEHKSSVRTKPGPKPKPPPWEEGILTCDFCHKYFKRDWFFQCHKILKHSSPDTVQCTLCSASPFSSNTELLAHVRFQHRNGQLRHACPICNKHFRVRAQLREHHKIEHHGRVEFSCSTCPKKFKSAKVFDRHSQQCKANSEISYPCSTCGQNFSTKQKLERHVRSSHTGEKPFECLECHCRFAMKCDLTAHMKVHNQDRARHYQCHVCGKTFFERYYLPRHMLQHQGIKNFSCQHCGDLFTTNYGLRKHCWRKHGQPRPKLRKSLGSEVKDRNVISIVSEKQTLPPPPPPPSIHQENKSLISLSTVPPNLSNVSHPEIGDLPSQEPYLSQKVFVTGSGATNGNNQATNQSYQQTGPIWHGDRNKDASCPITQETFPTHSTHCLASSTSSGNISEASDAASPSDTTLSYLQTLTPLIILEQQSQNCNPYSTESVLTPLLTQVQQDLQSADYLHRDQRMQQPQDTIFLKEAANAHSSVIMSRIQKATAEDVVHPEACNTNERQEKTHRTLHSTLIHSGTFVGETDAMQASMSSAQDRPDALPYVSETVSDTNKSVEDPYSQLPSVDDAQSLSDGRHSSSADGFYFSYCK